MCTAAPRQSLRILSGRRRVNAATSGSTFPARLRLDRARLRPNPVLLLLPPPTRHDTPRRSCPDTPAPSSRTTGFPPAVLKLASPPPRPPAASSLTRARPEFVLTLPPHSRRSNPATPEPALPGSALDYLRSGGSAPPRI